MQAQPNPGCEVAPQGSKQLLSLCVYIVVPTRSLIHILLVKHVHPSWAQHASDKLLHDLYSLGLQTAVSELIRVSEREQPACSASARAAHQQSQLCLSTDCAVHTVPIPAWPSIPHCRRPWLAAAGLCSLVLCMLRSILHCTRTAANSATARSLATACLPVLCSLPILRDTV